MWRRRRTTGRRGRAGRRTSTTTAGRCRRCSAPASASCIARSTTVRTSVVTPAAAGRRSAGTGSAAATARSTGRCRVARTSSSACRRWVSACSARRRPRRRRRRPPGGDGGGADQLAGRPQVPGELVRVGRAVPLSCVGDARRAAGPRDRPAAGRATTSWTSACTNRAARRRRRAARRARAGPPRRTRRAPRRWPSRRRRPRRGRSKSRPMTAAAASRSRTGAGQAVEPAGDDVAHAGRRRQSRPGQPAAVAVVEQQPGQLADEEGLPPVRSCSSATSGPRASGRRRPREVVDQVGDVGGPQPGEAELVRDVLPGDGGERGLRAPRSARPAGRGRPRRAAAAGWPGRGEVGQQLEAGQVGPVEVVERDHHGRRRPACRMNAETAS